MLLIRQFLAATFAILSTAFVGCSSLVKFDEGTFFECRIKPLDSGRVEFSIKNISNRRLAVLRWNIPISNEPLCRNLFEVQQGGKKVPYVGRIVEFIEDESAIRYLKPAEVITVVVPIRDSYRAKADDAILVKYDSCLQFAVVGESTRKRSIKDLNRIECMTSNGVLVK